MYAVSMPQKGVNHGPRDTMSIFMEVCISVIGSVAGVDSNAVIKHTIYVANRVLLRSWDDI